MHGFSKWASWAARGELPDLQYPGVYVLAISDVALAGQPFEWIKRIAYVGMSNAQGGLGSRLKQFSDTIFGKTGHGGAERFRHKHADPDTLVQQLYVSVRVIACDVRSNLPDDLRKMGEVAQLEYRCLAEYRERFGMLPEFNDRKRSPKGQRGRLHSGSKRTANGPLQPPAAASARAARTRKGVRRGRG